MQATSSANAAGSAEASGRCWLMKAEPDTRLEKGKDVAFSIDHLEKIKRSPWDGVRNPLAKRYMKEEMKLGDRILFYHSNTKMPGVAGLAEVVREGYPDFTAWDPDHPYYDPKSKQNDPNWFMVDVEFRSKVDNFVPLSLFKYLASCNEVPRELPYLTADHLTAIKAMPLINRGRLSVQSVPELAYEATVLMGEHGGFEGLVEVKKANKKRPAQGTAGNGSSRNGRGTGRDDNASERSREDSDVPLSAGPSSAGFSPSVEGQHQGGDDHSKRLRRR